MNIAVFCPNPIGDTVMATPAFRALRRGFPQATIAGIIQPHGAPVLDGTGWFDFLISFEPRADGFAGRTVLVVRRLRREQFDLAVLLPNSFRIAAMARLAGIPRRIGYVRYGRGWLLTDRLEYPRDSAGRRIPHPVVESYLEIVRQLGCPVNSARIELATTRDDEAAADRAYAARNGSSASTPAGRLARPRTGPHITLQVWRVRWQIRRGPRFWFSAGRENKRQQPRSWRRRAIPAC
jgi:heptosyltransferase II